MRKVLMIISFLFLLASGCGPASLAPSPSAETATPLPEQELASIIYRHPSEVDNSLLPITPIEEIHTTGQAVEVDIDEYRLVIDGLVKQPLTLTYDEILARPQTSRVVLLICPGTFWDNAQWTGTPLAPLLEEAGLMEGARLVKFHALDGYEARLPLEKALADGVFLAYQVDGQALPPEHGFPLRLVIRNEYGGKWVKWLGRIEVTA
jgi:DMSO/TMAO reductase YedYZ molybdopterin-dependent catalytic subunit